MDNQKDTQKADGVVKFVEATSVKTNPFGENRVGERAYRRAERIAAALVLLSSHVSDTEPLRSKIRAASLKMLDDVLSLRSEMRSVNSENAARLKSTVRELISITRMFAVAGFASVQNAGVVIEALDELSGFLSASQRSPFSESSSFTREDFLDVRESAAPQRTTVREKNVVEKDTKDDSRTSDVDSVPVHKTVNLDKSLPTKAPQRSSRSKLIIEVLKAGGDMGIRDIASSLPEFSEKMVQRELAVLVHDGLVVKSGEKRWSRYALTAND